jgi:hypothetical protein
MHKKELLWIGPGGAIQIVFFSPSTIPILMLMEHRCRNNYLALYVASDKHSEGSNMGFPWIDQGECDPTLVASPS